VLSGPQVLTIVGPKKQKELAHLLD
jgi:hypothetical protein